MWKRTFSNVTDKKNRLPLTTLKAFIVVSSRAATMQPSSTDPPSHSPANAAMLLRQRSAENSQSVNDRSRSTSRIKQARCCSLLSEQARPDWSETTKLVKRLTVMFSSIANLFWPTRGRRQWMLRAGEQRLAPEWNTRVQMSVAAPEKQRKKWRSKEIKTRCHRCGVHKLGSTFKRAINLTRTNNKKTVTKSKQIASSCKTTRNWVVQTQGLHLPGRIEIHKQVAVVDFGCPYQFLVFMIDLFFRWGKRRQQIRYVGLRKGRHNGLHETIHDCFSVDVPFFL